MRRAFVLEPTDYNVNEAKEYGSLVWLFSSKKQHSPPASVKFPAELVSRLKEFNYDPANDVFVMTGQMHAMVMVAATLVSEYGPVDGLFHDGASYVPVLMGEVSHERSGQGRVR